MLMMLPLLVINISKRKFLQEQEIKNIANNNLAIQQIKESQTKIKEANKL